MSRTNSHQQLIIRGILVALLFLAASSASAIKVSGRLVLGAYKPSKEEKSIRPPFYWELENGFIEVKKDQIDPERELAVVLVGDSAKKVDSNIEISFFGGSLLPSTIVVSPGTTLRIRNTDEIAHEVWAEGLESFSVEATSPRSIRSVQLSKEGNWPLRDKLVLHLRGHLHVIPNLVAVAEVKKNGDFVFEDVEAGKYTLKVFHGPKELVSEPIVVAIRREVTLSPLTVSNSK